MLNRLIPDVYILPRISVIILSVISDLLSFVSLFKTPVDKCGVSRLISGVDTIKIEDSVNTRPGKLYKVN